MQATMRQANTPKGRRGTVQVRAALSRASPDPRAASPPLQTQESCRAKTAQPGEMLAVERR
jgi:hypothetical protein